MWTLEDFQRHERILQKIVDTVEKAGLSCATDDYPMIHVYDRRGKDFVGTFHADDIMYISEQVEEC